MSAAVPARYAREVPQSFIDGLAKVKATEDAAELCTAGRGPEEREQRKAVSWPNSIRIDALSLRPSQQPVKARRPGGRPGRTDGSGAAWFWRRLVRFTRAPYHLFYPGQA